MKSLKYLLSIVALTGALAISAHADLMFLGATDFASQPNNNPDSNAQALADFLHVDVSTITLVTGGNHENLSGDTQIPVSPGNFVVAHYGDQHGGSLEFFRVVNGETQVTVPGSPNSHDPFANNPDSLSSARVFSGPGGVPDSGATVMLLGGVLAGLGLARHYLKR